MEGCSTSGACIGEERHAEYDSDMNRLIALGEASASGVFINQASHVLQARRFKWGRLPSAGGEPLRAAHLGWGLSRPATERVGERARLLEPKQPGHLRNRKLGIFEVPQGELAPHLIEH